MTLPADERAAMRQPVRLVLDRPLTWRERAWLVIRRRDPRIVWSGDMERVGPALLLGRSR